MKIRSSKIRSLCFVALAVLGGAQLAHAQDSATPPAGSGAGAAWCQQHPERCEQAKERIKAKCDADPAKCEEMKKKMQEKAAECQANPESCKEERRAKLEEACKANPDRPICKRLSASPAK